MNLLPLLLETIYLTFLYKMNCTGVWHGGLISTFLPSALNVSTDRTSNKCG